MRGQVDNQVLGWLLLGVGVIIIAMTVSWVWPVLFTDPLEEQTCAAQVIAHQKIAEASKGDTAPPISCPTRVVNVSDESDREVLYTIAEEIKWCWDTWGKGEFTLFDQDGTYCHMCSVISFEEQRTVPGLFEYLYTTDVRPGVSYVDYFTPNHVGDRFTDDEFIQELRRSPLAGRDVLGSDMSHVVLFYHVRGEEQLLAWMDGLDQDSAGALGTGAVTGLVLGYAAEAGTVAALSALGLCATGVGCLVVGGVGALAGVSTGLLTGSGASFLTYFLTNDPPESFSSVIFRPLTPEQIGDLRCERSFANR